MAKHGWRRFGRVSRALLWFAYSPRLLAAGYLGVLVTAGAIDAAVEHRSAGEAVWWTVATTATAGYADTAPTTAAGRAVAGVLVLSTLLLVVPLMTVHLSRRLIARDRAVAQAERDEIRAQLYAIRLYLEEQRRAAGLSSDLVNHIPRQALRAGPYSPEHLATPDVWSETP